MIMVGPLGLSARARIPCSFVAPRTCAVAAFVRPQLRTVHSGRHLRCSSLTLRPSHSLAVRVAKDMALQVGDVPVGLGKMLLFLSTIHGFAPTTRSPGRESPGAFPFLCIGDIRAASIEGTD